MNALSASVARRLMLIVLLASVSVAGCTRFPLKDSRVLMGTEIEITVHAVDGRMSRSRVLAVIDSAFAEVKRIEELCKWKELSRLNGYAGFQDAHIGSELIGLIYHAYDISERTQGAFRPDIGPLVDLWQIGTINARIPEIHEVDAALDIMDRTVFYPTDSVRARLEPSRASIELGAIAKGYAVDRACEVLQDLGVTAGMVWAGGDLRTFGGKPDGTPWRIAIRHPRNPSEFLRVLEIGEAAVATSGDYERFSELEGGRYCHIFDPWEGAPSRASVSATVVMETCMDADAYSTALFVLGPEEGIALAEQLGIAALVAGEVADDLLTFETHDFNTVASER